LGMQIPEPSIDAIGKALIICAVVLTIRWVGIFLWVEVLGGGNRLAILATVNLSEISEFGLVLCSIGKNLEPSHIGEDTLTIMIWTFIFLAVGASYLIKFNHAIYHKVEHCIRAVRGKCGKGGPDVQGDSAEAGGHDEDEEERDVIILGFHRIASALITEFEARVPQILKKIRVIDHKENIRKQLTAKHVAFTYGDISSPDVLEHCHHGPVDLVLLTIPDSIMTGVSNVRMLEVVKQVWPNAHIIVTADHPGDVEKLYAAGAHYVMQYVNLSAERITDMLHDHYSTGLAGGELKHLLEHNRDSDQVKASSSTEISRVTMRAVMSAPFSKKK